MSKGIKIHFNTLFVIFMALMSLNACQKRIATTNGQILYDPNEEEYSYAGQTSGTQQYTQDKKSKTYQHQQQEIMDLYNKNPNINPDSSKNVDENYYYAGQVESKQDQNNTKQQEDNYYYAGQTNGNIKTKTSTANKNKQDNKADNKQNNTNVVAPVILNNSKNKQPTNAIDKLNQPTKSADGKYTYVPNAQKAGIKNTNSDNVITDRELNEKLYGSMDGKFKKSKLEKVNKQSGLYSNKEEIISGNTNSNNAVNNNSVKQPTKQQIATKSTSTSTNGASSSGSSGSSSSWMSGDSVDLPDLNSSSFNPISDVSGSATTSGLDVASSAGSSGLSAANKATIGASVGAGGASLGASGASLASNLLGKGTPDLLGKSGSNALGKGKDISQNAKNKAKEQQKKDDKERQQNKKIYIQVNRYNNAQWAQKVLKELRKSYPTATSRLEGTSTVLLVGPYPNKMVGQAVKAKLISEGFTGAFFTNK